MAKANESKKAPVAKTSGLGQREWRGHTVWFCLTPGCVADSEVKANVERHIQRGKHRIAGATKPTAAVEAPVVDDDDDQDGDD